MESATQIIVFLSNGLKVRYRLAIDEFADLDLKAEFVLLRSLLYLRAKSLEDIHALGKKILATDEKVGKMIQIGQS
ncbi:hypothetical protein [Bacillus sp. B1-b2]|uniref:hypothetical protein n=1 Tax=Bacillus sp. B1-b2 TaxID=2653201 RepID=UPI001D00B2F9|nr:hypothetical protein [Bacillus sp. B1-b2]